LTLSTKAAISSACLSCFTCSFISCNTSFCSFRILADSSFWSSRAFSNASFFTSTASGLLFPLSPNSFLFLSREASGESSSFPSETTGSSFASANLSGTLSFPVSLGSTTGGSFGSTGATGSTRFTKSSSSTFLSSKAFTPVFEMFFTTSATSAPIFTSILESTMSASSGFLPTSTSAIGCAGAG